MRVGIIGASFAKAAFLPAFRHVAGAEVVALASSRLESAEAAAKPFGVKHVYADWQLMLQEQSLDLVCIATPTVMHAPMVFAALEAGAHVLSEKPTAMDAQEAAAMLQMAEKLGRVHMIDHELRFNAKRKKLRELLQAGAIGTVRHVVVHNVGGSWADPKSRPAGDWWSLAKMGGGRLGANGSHQVDLLRWWLGEITAVSGTVKTMVPDRIDPRTGASWTATADDLVQFSAEFASGTLANVLISTIARHGAANETTFYGSEGTITLSNDTEKLMMGAVGEPLQEIEVANPYDGLEGVNAGIWNQSVVGAVQELCAAISEKRALREGATFRDGLQNQRVLDAIRDSEAQRQWVAVPQ
ncbi:MAG: Gfo/Idh/MocA family oxidoreductase [Acidobacteriaceae bacterium]|nr:Gfo/Idh/MocA family oxidoreductase [Acidobacteriaceae bacterium]